MSRKMLAITVFTFVAAGSPYAQDWTLVGNAGTDPRVNFIGTTDNQAVVIRADDKEALRIYPHVTSPRIVAGCESNYISGGYGNTIAGGGEPQHPNIIAPYTNLATISGGSGNHADGWYSTIGGGKGNQTIPFPGEWPGDLAEESYGTIGGGANNIAGSGATVGGGVDNIAKDGGTVGGGGGNEARNAGTVGGGGGNEANGPWATIGGGYQNKATDECPTIGGGAENEATEDYATIGGGHDNVASGNSSTIGGGHDNVAGGNSSTIGGGLENEATEVNATIGGGYGNVASGNSSTIGGGYDNVASGNSSTIGGGYGNVASGWASTIGGGQKNKASGAFSFAAGRRAKAIHEGSFVWGDSTDGKVKSRGKDVFLARATGGVYFYSGPTSSSWVPSWFPGASEEVTPGVHLAAGSNSWSGLSSRAAKTNLAPVDGHEILADLAKIPVTTWNYKSQDKSIRHIGPMAEDFYAAFRVGEDDKHLTTIDVDGVALASIQALYEQVLEKEERIGELERLNRESEARVGNLQAQVDTLADRVAELSEAVSARQ